MAIPAPLQQQLALALELSLNRYLTLDPDNRQRLQPLKNATVELALTGTGLTFYLHGQTDGLTVHSQFDETPDATLRGSIAGFLAMGLSPELNPVFSTGAVSIEGDSHIARQFQRLITDAEIDWSGLLATLTGDLVAEAGEQTLRSATIYARHTRDDLLQNFSEYLRYERHWLPLRPTVESWLRGVDTLRDDLARFEQQLDRAEKKHHE